MLCAYVAGAGKSSHICKWQNHLTSVWPSAKYSAVSYFMEIVYKSILRRGLTVLPVTWLTLDQKIVDGLMLFLTLHLAI